MFYVGVTSLRGDPFRLAMYGQSFVGRGFHTDTKPGKVAKEWSLSQDMGHGWMLFAVSSVV